MVIKRTRVHLKFIIYLSLGLFFSCFLIQNLPAAQAAGAAVNFSLNDLNDNPVSLNDFKGKPVILFFWASWCPVCRTEFPAVIKEYEKMKAAGITLLSIDIGEPKERAASFIRSQNAQFPVLLDQDSKVAYSYNLVGVPTFILIDASGEIKYNGNAFPEDYLKLINS